jgi:hypothetical protein
MKRGNARKDAKAVEFNRLGQKDPDSGKGIDELFDYHPNFRYVL